MLHQTPPNQDSKKRRQTPLALPIPALLVPVYPQNPFETDSYPIPLSVSSSRLETGRMTFNTSNPQHPTEEILHSSFHRSSSESISPLAMESDHYDKSKTQHHQCNTSEIPPQDLYSSNKSNTYRHHHQYDTSEITLQGTYLAPPSLVLKSSFLPALKLAREKRKWFLINIQSATVPACGILNREIWHHPDIANIVSQSFVFLQLNHNDEGAEAYFGKYYGVMELDEDGKGLLCARNNRKIMQLPHIALLDPVSGYRWEVWEGPGLPDKDRFLADLSEYEMVGEGSWCEWGKGIIRTRD